MRSAAKRSLVALGIATSAASWAPGALAERPGGGPGHGLERMLEELGLDDETLAAVDRVLDEARTRRREQHRAVRDAHEAMRALLDQAEPDETAILAQADAIGALELEAKKSRLRTLLQVRKLLPERARARLLEQMREGPHQRRGPRPGAPW